MKVENAMTGEIYDSIEAALKNGCVSNTSLAIAINKTYISRNINPADLCESGDFFYAWETGLRNLAEDIEKYDNYSLFNLIPLESFFSKGDIVEIIDKGQIYDTYSGIFDNYEGWGLSLRDVAEWCYGDGDPNLSECYVVKAIMISNDILYIKGKTSQRGYLIDFRGVRRKKI